MLGVYPFQQKKNISSGFVRCPVCNRGHLCNTFSHTVIRMSPDSTAEMRQTDDAVILKCPKCARQIVLVLKSTP